MSNSLKAKDQIIYTEFDGGDGILVDLRTRRYYQLNETAAIVWKGLEKGTSVEAIAAEIGALYEVQPERARSSVEGLTAQLESYRLVANSSASEVI
jgi:hypothetical protein